MIGDPAQPGFRPASARVKRRLPVPFGGGVSKLEDYGISDGAFYCRKAQEETQKWLARLEKTKLYPNALEKYQAAVQNEQRQCASGASEVYDKTTSETAQKWVQSRIEQKSWLEQQQATAPTRWQAAREATTMYAATGASPPRLVIGGAVALVGLVVTVVLWKRFA